MRVRCRQGFLFRAITHRRSAVVPRRVGPTTPPPTQLAAAAPRRLGIPGTGAGASPGPARSTCTHWTPGSPRAPAHMHGAGGSPGLPGATRLMRRTLWRWQRLCTTQPSSEPPLHRRAWKPTHQRYHSPSEEKHDMLPRVVEACSRHDRVFQTAATWAALASLSRSVTTPRTGGGQHGYGRQQAAHAAPLHRNGYG
jgi:hypothetical protein